MNKKLKDKIVSSFENVTPDLSEKIKEKCENQPIERSFDENTQIKTEKKKSIYIKRTVFALAFVLIFAVGLILGNFIDFSETEKVKATSEFYIDVNPSVKLEISDYKRVIRAEALNEDATEIINELELEGVEVNTAVYAIIGKMLEMGYLTGDTNSVLFSFCDEKGEQTEFIGDIAEKMNKLLDGCSIIAQNIDIDDEMKRRAEEYDISVGKMAFIDKIIGFDEAYEGRQNEFAEKSIKELAFMYNRDGGAKDDIIKGDENFSQENEVFDKVWTQAKKDYSFSDEVRAYGVEITIDGREETKKYRISFEAEGRRFFYEYDCQDGKITDKTGDYSRPAQPPEPHFDEEMRITK